MFNPEKMFCWFNMKLNSRTGKIYQLFEGEVRNFLHEMGHQLGFALGLLGLFAFQLLRYQPYEAQPLAPSDLGDPADSPSETQRSMKKATVVMYRQE
jgi:hypothetical protein